MTTLSNRSAVEPFHAMDVLAEANRRRAAGHPIISMAVGQPADSAPVVVRQAAERALKDGRIGYTDALGLIELREAIAAHYADHYGVSVSPERIAVTTGSSAAFNLAFIVYFDPGDRVAITRPGYPAYRNILTALGLEVVEIPTGHGTSSSLTAQALAAAHAEKPLKGVLFASPANPTGAVIDKPELTAIIETARNLGIRVISDEIYHRLSYEADDVTALEVADDVTVINSFSKYYCMTGWRIGWMVLPDNDIRAIERLSQSLYISAPELSQRGAIEAFRATVELERIKDRYRRNRLILLDHLPRMGLDLAAPMDGAFYAYCDVSRFTNDSMEFVRRMISEINIAATPGRDFDPLDGHRTVRFSYAGKVEEMEEAVRRLDDWLPKQKA
ncbi:aminotransferase class I/II-fold pyridoxal phosphate-dependent enzyme [Brucella sp. 10RB9214]|uniref:pyridoxal phosphate-dependent aminotransferase n=1 Tax=unclassified Brucella TaxID=2632610 RepID=UPI000972C4D7|nr:MULTISPECIES: aminotransferase class I/II-fold pyridoxal phosphate-dependent enzyme [unclassified Brucella]APY12949.1 1-aminocyclopropane-1-carboxylate deaminase [Brucella sp. 09RB8910]MRN47110.1 aminotransferase class I/II-fold pyridoxal phosphate-dependent enzyme [Brucella sp. 10RB9212]MRN50466.1 aminotransferase class I/II-fold pyridoxal phosphate-dependent enzyme [Brucella sp. 10RB9214]